MAHGETLNDVSMAEWVKDHDWRAQAKREDLIFCAIQLQGARKTRDEDAISMWISEVLTILGIYDMTDDEKQGIVDRHFADLIATVGE